MKILLSILLTALLFAGCKKKDVAQLQPLHVKTTLLSKATYTFGSVVRVDTYSYDDKNRLIDFNAVHQGFDFKFTYDATGNLVTGTEYYPTGMVSRSAKFAYSGSNVVVTEYDENGVLRNTHNWTLNAQKLVSVWVDAGITTNYTYDNVNNLTKWTGQGTTETYTFDSKKNPLSMMASFNYYMMYFINENYCSFINNILTDSLQNETITYVYNSDDFPTTANVTRGANTNTVNYEYTIK